MLLQSNIDKDKAEVGDIIVVIDPKIKDLFEVECIVVDCDVVPFAIEDISECIWATVNKEHHGGAFWLRHCQYKVIKRVNSTTMNSCEDLEKKVQEARHELLRNMFS